MLVTKAVFTQNFTESDLPLILINTQGKKIPDEPKLTATMKVINNKDRISKEKDPTRVFMNAPAGTHSTYTTSFILPPSQY